jgi:hypothetical protein
MRMLTSFLYYFADTFRVTIEQNEDAKIWSLSGDYWLTVSPDIISIKSLEDSSIQEWNLNFIRRFFMDKNVCSKCYTE